MKKLPLLLFAISLVTFAQPLFAKVKESTLKFGVLHQTQMNSEYTLSGATGSGNENLVGVSFFMEKVFLSRFSAGMRFSSMLARSNNYTASGNTVVAVETTGMTTFDFKAFFRGHDRPGMKPYLGVSFGSYTPATEINTISGGTATSSTTSATVPVTILSVGMDYTMDMGGIRADLGIVTGKQNDYTNTTYTTSTYNYGGTAISIGVFSFF